MPPISTERTPQMKKRLRMRRSRPDSDGFLTSSCESPVAHVSTLLVKLTPCHPATRVQPLCAMNDPPSIVNPKSTIAFPVKVFTL